MNEATAVDAPSHLEREKAIKRNAKRVAKLKAEIDSLTAEQATLLTEAHVLDGRSYAYLASLVGLTRGRIGQIVKAIEVNKNA